MAQVRFIAIETDAKEWKDTVRALMQHSQYKTGPKMVRHMGSVLAGTLTSWTPPRGKNPQNETWAQQKKLGMAAVARDIGRVFWRADTWTPAFTEDSAKNARAWFKAVRSGAVDSVRAMMAAFNVPSRGVMLSPDPYAHQSSKRRGKVPENFTPPYYVLRSGDLKTYIREVQKRVGEWKHGWLAAINGLKVPRIPQWIKRQNSDPGTFYDQSTQRRDPFIDLGNRANKTGIVESNKILIPAIKFTELKVRRELEAILADLKKAVER